MPNQTLLSDADFGAQVTLEPAIRPAPKWKNKYLAMEDCFAWDVATDRTFELKRGDVTWSSRVFPSKDAAETYALDLRAKDAAEHPDNPSTLEYLGAFPIEGDA